MNARTLTVPALAFLLGVAQVLGGPPKSAEKPGADAKPDPICELADVASFGATIDRREGYDCRAVSGWGQTLQRDRIADGIVRLDRLIVSGDAEISAMATEVRRIAVDSWCLNNAQYDFGYTLRNQENLTRDLFRAGVGYCVSSWFDSQPVETEVTGIANGRIYETRYYRSEPSAETERRETELSNAIQALAGQTKKSQRLTDRVKVAQWQLQDRLAQLWEDRLWPVLKKRAGAEADKRLIRSTNPDSFPDKKLVPVLPYGSIMLASVGPKPLTRVALWIKWKTDLGDEGTWFAYFPSLHPSRRVLVLPHGEVGCALHGTCSKMEATVSVVCDQGQEFERSVALGRPGANSPQAKWKAPFIAEQRDRIKRENAEYAKGTDGLIYVCRNAYPEPPNREHARERLIRVLGNGQKYIGWCKVENSIPMLVECEKFDGTSDTVAINISFPGKSGVLTDHCKAKLIDELERGVVLGMEHEMLPAKSAGGSKTSPQVSPSRRERSRRSGMSRPRKNTTTGANRGPSERKLITSPRDIESNTTPLDWGDIGEIMAKGPSPSNQRSPSVTWAIADYVIYVDESDRVMIQLFYDPGVEMKFARLFPADEKAKQ